MASLYKTVTKGEFKNIPRQYSDQLGAIIGRMLTVRPKNRISLCKSNWFFAKLFILYTINMVDLSLCFYDRGTVTCSVGVTDRRRIRSDAQATGLALWLRDEHCYALV